MTLVTLAAILQLKFGAITTMAVLMPNKVRTL